MKRSPDRSTVELHDHHPDASGNSADIAPARGCYDCQSSAVLRHSSPRIVPVLVAKGDPSFSEPAGDDEQLCDQHGHDARLEMA